MFHAPIIGRLVLGLAASTLGSLALVPAGPVQAQPAEVTVLGGSARGSWYPIAVGIAEILNDAGTRASGQIGGGNANVVSVSNGQAEMGITFNFTAATAAKGEEPFRQTHDDIRSIAGLFAFSTSGAAIMRR